MMERYFWLKPKRAAGVCAGLVIVGLVPISGWGSAVASQPAPSAFSPAAPAPAPIPAPTRGADEAQNGSATWTGSSWVIVDSPDADAAIPEPPLHREVTPGIDGDYQRWEATQTGIAETELIRRLAEDVSSAQNLKLRREYYKWESFLVAEAHKELAHRLDLASRADSELAAAVAKVEATKQAVLKAPEAERVQAAAEVETAEAELQAAIAVKEEADIVVERHQSRAVSEANNLKESQAKAIASIAADRDATMLEGMGVRAYADPVEMVVTQYTNLRRGPGAGYEKTGELPAGTEVSVIGRGHGYYRLATGGFVSELFVSEPGPDAVAELMVTGGIAGNGGGFAGSALGTPVDPPTKYAFQSYVANSDSQDAVDACTGGLTYSPDISKILGKSYYPIHNICGGMPILDLKNGNTVYIKGVGTYKVVDSKDVSRGDTTSVLKGITGSILLQTCYPKSTKMRVVGLEPA